MIADSWTVVTKELREIIAANGSRRSGIVAILIVLAASIALPTSIGTGWLTSPAVLAVYGVYLPMAMVMSVVADSFAGERERHTLETLLSTRLSDRAILFGKLGASILYGLSLSLIGWIIAAIAADIARPSSHVFYTSSIAAGTIILAILTTTLMAGIGVLVSLRADSVRQAQQLTSVFFIFVYLLPIFLFVILPQSLRDHLFGWISTTDPNQVALVLFIIIGVIDAVLVGIAMLRFRRARLILG